MKKIIIVRPYGYYGGTLILDLLCKLLRENGVDARIFKPCDGIREGVFAEEGI